MSVKTINKEELIQTLFNSNLDTDALMTTVKILKSLDNSIEIELKKVSERCKRDNFVIVGLGLDSEHLTDMYHYHQVLSANLLTDKKTPEDIIFACKTINAAIKDVFT